MKQDTNPFREEDTVSINEAPYVGVLGTVVAVYTEYGPRYSYQVDFEVNGEQKSRGYLHAALLRPEDAGTVPPYVHYFPPMDTEIEPTEPLPFLGDEVIPYQADQADHFVVRWED